MAAAELGPEPGADAGPDQLQRDIERTRDQTAETLGALAAKLDVKERAKHKIADSKQRVTQGSQDAKQVAVALFKENTPAAVVGIAALAALAGLLMWVRRH